MEQTNAKFFDYWYSHQHLADDFGVPLRTAQSWPARGAIPPKYNARRYQLILKYGGQAEADAFMRSCVGLVEEDVPQQRASG